MAASCSGTGNDEVHPGAGSVTEYLWFMNLLAEPAATRYMV